MQPFIYTKEHWPTLAAGQQREWSVQNGAGGYAGGSLVDAPARHHHGLLVASLCPPNRRTMVWQHLGMKLAAGGHAAWLSSLRFADGTQQDGTPALQQFVWDGLPRWDYEALGVRITRRLTTVREQNAAAVAFVIQTEAQPATLTLRPCMTWRAAGDRSDLANTQFQLILQQSSALLTTAAAPGWPVCFAWQADGLTCTTAVKPWVSAPIALQTEIDTGDPTPERLRSDFTLTLHIPAHTEARFSLVCGVDIHPSRLPNAFDAIAQEYTRQQAVLAQSGLTDPTARRLVLSTDQFISRRQSTGGHTLLAGLPWFADWGRDTMIAFEGCCLVPRRFAEARSILATFAQYEQGGLVPNMFPDEGTAPLYNTVDASLWYINAVALYDRYTHGADAEFIRRRLWPCVLRILAGYERGTDFSIGMDPRDSLIHAGGGTDQVTWMDVRVGDWVPTPRHGKPVEINALWYAALCNGAALARRFGFGSFAEHYEALAAQVRSSYCFFATPMGYLYDCLTPTGPDGTLRPNQLLAASLWRLLPEDAPPLLSRAEARRLVDIVQKELYAGPGIRTLPEWDRNYHPYYKGSLPQRDAAYHQGTAWGWLMGEFLLAHAYAYADDPAEPQTLRRLIAPALHELEQGGINGIAEIFDATAPHTSRGCFHQAWSVGEILAAYCRLGLEEPHE